MSRTPRHPATNLARKFQRLQVDTPDEVLAAARRERRAWSGATRRRMGRPITSTHPRAEYWREYKRRKLGNAGANGLRSGDVLGDQNKENQT